MHAYPVKVSSFKPVVVNTSIKNSFVKTRVTEVNNLFLVNACPLASVLLVFIFVLMDVINTYLT